MKARLSLLLFLGSVLLSVASVGLAAQQPNPFYIPSSKFQTRFINGKGSIQVLPKFSDLSEHLQFLQDYRIARYRTVPGTVVLPHHSDAENLLIVTQGFAVVKVYVDGEDQIPPLLLNQSDVLRIPAGALSYIINTGGPSRHHNLEFLKLAQPTNYPGQSQDLFPAGNFAPSSYYQVFDKLTLRAAFKAPFEDVKNALWGADQWKNDVIVGLSETKINALTEDARSSKSEDDIPLTSLGPIPLKNIRPLYSNDYGAFHEALPTKYSPLANLTIGANFLDLHRGSMFMPHYNGRAIILAYVVNGDGNHELGSPYPINETPQNGAEVGYIEKLTARVAKGDMYVIPAGFPNSVNSQKDTEFKVVEFMLNAPNNNRIFLTGDEGNVAKQVDPSLLSRNPTAVQKLFKHQTSSFFARREGQPRTENAWAIY